MRDFHQFNYSLLRNNVALNSTANLTLKSGIGSLGSEDNIDVANPAVITAIPHTETVISQSTSVLDTIYANTKHLPCHYPRSFKPVNAARLL